MVLFLGIEFAPLWIPLARRLQTIAVFQWTLSFLFLGIACLTFMVYLLFTSFYPIPLLYLMWYIYDRKTIEQGGRRCNWVREWRIWKYYRDFFPIQLVKTADLDPSKNHIFALHPHGIMCDGPFCNFGTEATGFSEVFPGLRPILTTIRYQFLFPLHREYFMSTGAVSCSKASMEYCLTQMGTGNALVLIVGGAFESLEARPGSLSVNVSRRKGFIRVALKHGVNICPVYSFGENDIFAQANNPPGSRLRAFQQWVIKWLGFTCPMFHGRGVFNYTFGLLPYRNPITTVVGAPILVEKQRDVTEKQVDELHQTYIHKLVELFEAHKLENGLTEDDHLEIL